MRKQLSSSTPIPQLRKATGKSSRFGLGDSSSGLGFGCGFADLQECRLFRVFGACDERLHEGSALQRLAVVVVVALDDGAALGAARARELARAQRFRRVRTLEVIQDVFDALLIVGFAALLTRLQRVRLLFQLCYLLAVLLNLRAVQSVSMHRVQHHQLGCLLFELGCLLFELVLELFLSKQITWGNKKS